MRPPAKIFQCRNGHVMCGECAEHPEAVVRCPSCRVPLRGKGETFAMKPNVIHRGFFSASIAWQILYSNFPERKAFT